MFEIDQDNVIDFLRRSGRLAAGDSATACELAWGVSNIVLRVESAGSGDLVIKQSRERLRTQADWFSRLDRIWREADVMRCLGPLLPAGAVPAILFEDRDNYLFAMEAIASDHLIWKAELLEGRLHPEVAAHMGDYLAAMHRETFGSAELRERFGDRQVFFELRVEPFYLRLAQSHPSLREHLDQLVAEMDATAVCLVHADFSPKNILIAGDRFVLVDYETGHFGDSAFDLGFFLSHLLLKTVLHATRRGEFLAIARVFWQRYCEGISPLQRESAMSRSDLDRRTIGHLAGCMLARIDGTSPVDYLDDDQQQFVRGFASALFRSPPNSVDEAFERLDGELRDHCR